MLAAEAARRGWDLEVVVDEGVSGKSLDGWPALASALASWTVARPMRCSRQTLTSGAYSSSVGLRGFNRSGNR